MHPARVVLALTLALGATLPAAERPALATSSGPRLAVHLIGTSPTGTAPSRHQSAWGPLARAIGPASSGLAIPLARQAIVNYTDEFEADATTRAPRVRSSFGRGAAATSATSGCMTGRPAGVLDTWGHAYDVAWLLDDLLAENTASDGTAPSLILFGHSQGGLIARILQLVAAGEVPDRTDLGTDCWPIARLRSSLLERGGVVTLGAPLAPTAGCPQLDPLAFGSEREWVYARRQLAGPTIALGGSPAEHVDIPGIGSRWLNGDRCATAIANTAAGMAVRLEFRGRAGTAVPLAGIQAGVLRTLFAPTLRSRGSHGRRIGDLFTLEGVRPALPYRGGVFKVLAVAGTGSLVFDGLPSGGTLARRASLRPLLRAVRHTDWTDGAGVCPALSASLRACSYRIASGRGAWGAWKRSSGPLEGTVYRILLPLIRAWPTW